MSQHVAAGRSSAGFAPGHAGTGPGAITRDGCAVELYLRLPVAGEIDIIEAAVPAGARILELGCGAGRMTAPLVRCGFEVTAVDESSEMLARVNARVRGARTVRSRIETLELDERFDVVMLASFLVHAGDPAVCQALLATCRRHLALGGCVLIQREGEGWHDDVPRQSSFDTATVRVLSSDPVGPGVRSVRIEYEFPDARWTQTFLSRELSADALAAALAVAGLRVDALVSDDGTWVRAVALE